MLQLLEQIIGDGREFVVAEVESSKRLLLKGFTILEDGISLIIFLSKSSTRKLVMPDTSDGKPLIKFFVRPKCFLV